MAVAVAPGATAQSRFTVAASAVSSGIIIQSDIYNTSGQRVSVHFVTAQALAAGEARAYIFNHVLPSTLPVGIYYLHVGIFNADWSTMYLQKYNAATFSVGTPVGSDTIAPVVSILTPSNNTFVDRRTSISITANATGNIGVSGVDIYVNGSRICTNTIANPVCTFRSGKRSGIAYDIQARARDAAGNTGTSAVIRVMTR